MNNLAIQNDDIWQDSRWNNLPKDWRVLTVDDVKALDKKSIISGPFGSNISSKFFVDEGVPVIRGNNLSLEIGKKFNDDGFAYISHSKATELNTWAKKDDLVFTAVGTIGQVGLLTGAEKFKQYIISNKQLRLTLNTQLVLPIFAYYWFASDFMVEQIIQRNTGSSVPLINLTVLKSLVIPVPSVPEQKAIANLLSSLDDKIDLLHRQNKTLEAMAETFFRQWFVEEAQDDWEIVKVGDFVKTNPDSINENYKHQFIDYLDTGSLTEGIVEQLQLLPMHEAPSRARRLVEHNDILISTVRPDQKHYGMIKNPNANLVVSTGFCVIRCVNIDPHFIYVLLTSNEMTDYLHTIAEGSTSTYPSLKPSDIEKVEFQLPPKNKLDDFAKIASDNWNKIELNHNQSKNPRS